jgi:hypothetical protein
VVVVDGVGVDDGVSDGVGFGDGVRSLVLVTAVGG